MDKLAGRRMKMPGPKKAAEMMKHGEVRGHPLTDKQRGFFGMAIREGIRRRRRGRP